MLVKKLHSLRAPPLSAVSVSVEALASSVCGPLYRAAVVSCERQLPHGSRQQPLAPVAAVLCRRRDTETDLAANAESLGQQQHQQQGKGAVGTLILLDSLPMAPTASTQSIIHAQLAELCESCSALYVTGGGDSSLLPSKVQQLVHNQTVQCANNELRAWFDVAFLNQQECIDHNFPGYVALRERVSGAVYCGEACGRVISLPRLGLGGGVVFPPPPFFPDPSFRQAVDLSRLQYLEGHIRTAQRVAHRITTLLASASPWSSKLVLVHEAAIANDGAEAMRQVDLVCTALLDAVRYVESRGLAADSDAELALWEHCFCRVVDMHIRERGSVATLLEVLRSRKGDGPTDEASYFHDLVAAWVGNV